MNLIILRNWNLVYSSLCHASERTYVKDILGLSLVLFSYQESPRGDDFRAQATEVLLGNTSWKVRGPESKIRRTIGKDESPRSH